MSRLPEIYAIDFGTTNSLLAGAHGEAVLPRVPLSPGQMKPEILKSMLYAAQNESWFYGDDAINEYLEQPGQGRVFKSLKRFLPDDSFTTTQVFSEKLTLSDLLAKFLRTMRQRANEYYQADVNEVVMGCPALFSGSEQAHQLALKRLKAASELAGFKTVHFLPEPIAAAYRFQSQLTRESLVLIADFGGGTSDFTVQKMSQKPFSPEDVMAIHGVSVAGDRYDGVIMKHDVSPHFGTAATFQKPTSTRPSEFPLSFLRMMCSPAELIMMNRQSAINKIQDVQQWVQDKADIKRIDDLLVLIEDRMGYALFRKIEEAKILLSDGDSAHFEFSYVDIDVQETLLRTSFEAHSQHLTDEILKSLDKCLAMASVTADDIDIVCMTGGTSMLPAINKELLRRFGDRLATSSQFDSVVQGLAERGRQLLNEAF